MIKEFKERYEKIKNELPEALTENVFMFISLKAKGILGSTIEIDNNLYLITELRKDGIVYGNGNKMSFKELEKYNNIIGTGFGDVHMPTYRIYLKEIED